MTPAFNTDSRVRKCAIDLQDTVLLAQLSAGDLISLEAVSLTSFSLRFTTEQADKQARK